MPIKLPNQLPAFDILKNKKVFVMDKDRAEHQDIRPLKIGLFNLMPTKEVTETQIFRMIGNSPLQIEPILIRTESYTPKNTSQNYLNDFYKTFNEIKEEGLDGLIITGAPVEHLPFEEVAYWNELTKIMDWANEYVCSTLHLCWAAQAGLFHHYEVPKYDLPAKMFGVFPHTHKDSQTLLLRGMDDEFFVPHSRHTEIHAEDINKVKDLEILSESEISGVYMVANKDRSSVFITGHPEYDRETLS
ncbi:MAG: homoserine O-succinyltransferase, partial [Candidatus Peregrinibacteria bacterium]|nr:homoserine O-succinyltransferase [Candidatus Peregrinibacteria bacterium]